MTDSLLLVEANLELIGSATNPQYRLGQADLGAAEPDTNVIRGLLLDGDQVFGDRDRNRTISLSIPVHAIGVTGTAAIRSALTAASDALLAAISKPTFTLQWTPDGGLPLLFDCFRGRGQRQRSIVRDNQGTTPLSLVFQAKPYGRSPILQSVAAAASDTQLDSYATAPTTGATLDTSVKYEGTGSAKVTLASVLTWIALRQYSTSTPVARTYASAKNLTGMRAVTMRMRWPEPGTSPATITATLVLTSAAGNATITATKTFNPGDTWWRLVSFPLTGNLGTLDITTVTGYSLTLISSGVASSSTTSFLWVDDQRMKTPSTALTTTTSAANLLLPAITGSARAPANVNLAAGASNVFGQFVLHFPPGDQDVDAQILTALSTGSADQTVTIAHDNAAFRGTYSLVLGAGVDGTAATMTVTVQQKNTTGNVGVPWVVTATRDVSTSGWLFPVGEITLPLYEVPVDNTDVYYTIRVNITAGTDRYSELMLLDTAGQTVITDQFGSISALNMYVDEPGPLQSGPMVYQSGSDRSRAYSKLAEVVVSGGPPVLEPGTNKVLAWVDFAGAPVVTASYFPRWLDERVV